MRVPMMPTRAPFELRGFCPTHAPNEEANGLTEKP
jgi:hypothetical protein